MDFYTDEQLEQWRPGNEWVAPTPTPESSLVIDTQALNAMNPYSALPDPEGTYVPPPPKPKAPQENYSHLIFGGQSPRVRPVEPVTETVVVNPPAANSAPAVQPTTEPAKPTHWTNDDLVENLEKKIFGEAGDPNKGKPVEPAAPTASAAAPAVKPVTEKENEFPQMKVTKEADGTTKITYIRPPATSPGGIAMEKYKQMSDIVSNQIRLQTGIDPTRIKDLQPPTNTALDNMRKWMARMGDNTSDSAIAERIAIDPRAAKVWQGLQQMAGSQYQEMMGQVGLAKKMYDEVMGQYKQSVSGGKPVGSMVPEIDPQTGVERYRVAPNVPQQVGANGAIMIGEDGKPYVYQPSKVQETVGPADPKSIQLMLTQSRLRLLDQVNAAVDKAKKAGKLSEGQNAAVMALQQAQMADPDKKDEALANGIDQVIRAGLLGPEFKTQYDNAVAQLIQRNAVVKRGSNAPATYTQLTPQSTPVQPVTQAPAASNVMGRMRYKGATAEVDRDTFNRYMAALKPGETYEVFNKQTRKWETHTKK